MDFILTKHDEFVIICVETPVLGRYLSGVEILGRWHGSEQGMLVFGLELAIHEWSKSTTPEHSFSRSLGLIRIFVWLPSELMNLQEERQPRLPYQVR